MRYKAQKYAKSDMDFISEIIEKIDNNSIEYARDMLVDWKNELYLTANAKKLEWKFSDGGRSKYFKTTGVGDCVVRAISLATGHEYIDIYNYFTNIGINPDKGVKVNIWRKYLIDNGWEEKTFLHNPYLNTNLPKNCIASTKNHLMYIKNHVIHDRGNLFTKNKWKKATHIFVKKTKEKAKRNIGRELK